MLTKILRHTLLTLSFHQAEARQNDRRRQPKQLNDVKDEPSGAIQAQETICVDS